MLGEEGRQESPGMSSSLGLLPGAQRPHTQVPLVALRGGGLATRASSIPAPWKPGERFLHIGPPDLPAQALGPAEETRVKEPHARPGSGQPGSWRVWGRVWPQAFLRVFFIFINPLSLLWPFGAMRKPQPRLLLGQSCPWGGQ